MAGAGYKLFNTGDVLTAAQVNTYLQEQVVMVFANATARTTALSGVLAEGMVSYLKDTNATEVYDGSAWVGIGNSGDITGVTAGTGISGGGTSGTVTITNSMATEITAAGDIIIGTGSGTFDNLPIGTTGQVLTADTTVSPYKVKWATAASSTPAFVGCQAYKSGSSQSVNSATYTAVTYDAESFDTDGFHSTATNTSRLTIPTGKAGKYRADVQIFFDAGSTPSGIRVGSIYKNGAVVASGDFRNTTTAESTSFTIVYVGDLIVGDYLECFVYHSQGSARTLAAGLANNAFTLTYLGA